jgi:hypothetical protein
VLLNHLPLGKAERAAPVLLRFAGEER